MISGETPAPFSLRADEGEMVDEHARDQVFRLRVRVIGRW